MCIRDSSEHCRHKIFNAQFVIDGVECEHSLFAMIRNTTARSPTGVLSAYRDNAAVISGSAATRWFPDPGSGVYARHEEPIDIVMKVETHNHPTAISPFPGAASFNNEFGRPAICGYFRTFEGTLREDPAGLSRGYHKPIMLAGGLGNVRRIDVEKATVAVGAALVVLGGPAMLIGLGGGAASSLGSGVSSEQLDFASVQRGNAEMQRRAQEVIDRCWGLGERNPIQLIHDVGAGGLSNAVPEAVSYTHLDVYKRQALGIARNSIRAPRWLCATASGTALESPPAPTS